MRGFICLAFVLVSKCYAFQNKRISFTSLRLQTSIQEPPITNIPSINNAPIREQFTSSWKEAIKGNSKDLYSLLAGNKKWENPVSSSSDEMKKLFQQCQDFFIEPALTIYQVSDVVNSKFTVEYHLSFWYPLPWRPRIIIPGMATVQLNPDSTSIESITETWEVSLLDIFLKQMPPRFWDLWNSYSTPTPEYPPIKEISTLGKVTFSEMPATVAMEIRWSGPSKYPGPPLLAIPGFALFGTLRTSRPNRDPFYTVLPVEVQSGRYICPTFKEDMKRTSWILHVPTSLHEKVFDKALQSTLVPIIEIEEDGEDDFVEEKDYVVGLENLNVRRDSTGGALRGDVPLDEELMKDFESKEKKEYFYRILPRRLIASIDINGDASAEKISLALKELKEVVLRDGARVLGKRVVMRMRDLDALPGVDGVPLLGLQLWGCKACFNGQAEPAMGVYELQYSSRVTRVFVELIPSN
jgi:hypothetical protein